MCIDTETMNITRLQSMRKENEKSPRISRRNRIRAYAGIDAGRVTRYTGACCTKARQGIGIHGTKKDAPEGVG